MSYRKNERSSHYPYKPERRRRPKSSSNGGGKRKVWLSAGTSFEGNRDISPRLNARWFDSPMFKQDRLARWA